MMMPESSKEMEKHATPGHHGRGRGSSEYVRLVISDEPRAVETEMLQPREESRINSFRWWMKVLLWCIASVIIGLVLLKWGVPFVFEKVLPLTLQLFWLNSCFS